MEDRHYLMREILPMSLNVIIADNVSPLGNFRPADVFCILN